MRNAFLTLFCWAHLDRLHCHEDRSVVAANVVCLGLPHLHTVIMSCFIRLRVQCPYFAKVALSQDSMKMATCFNPVL